MLSARSGDPEPKGHKLREIGRMLTCSRHAVTNALQRQRLPDAPAVWRPQPGPFTDAPQPRNIGTARGGERDGGRCGQARGTAKRRRAGDCSRSPAQPARLEAA